MRRQRKVPACGEPARRMAIAADDGFGEAHAGVLIRGGGETCCCGPLRQEGLRLKMCLAG